MKRLLTGTFAAAALMMLAGCAETPVQQAERTTVFSEPEFSLEIVEAETGQPATQPVDTIPVLTEDAADTESEAVTSDTTATQSVTEAVTSDETDASYDAGTLTDAGDSYTVEAVIDKDGTYTTKDDVALYIYTYGELPHNFISKKEAEKLGWEGGSLEPYAPGCSIGGSYFGNYEGNLPEKKGRSYTECDIDTLGKKSRGAKRIVFSNDGLIYYTEDHYKTFELLYGEE